MKRLFVNDENRIRAGWRILVQFVAWYVLLWVVGNVMILALNRQDAVGLGLVGVLYIGVGLALTWLAARWLDRRKFADYGFRLNREWWLDLAAGLALGALIPSVVFVVERSVGWLDVTSIAQTTLRGPFILTAASFLLLVTGIGINEELVFRGYHLPNLVEGVGLKKRTSGALLALLIPSSLVFATLHLGNPGANWLGWVNIVLAGLVLGYGYIRTGQLALPIGLHIAWNFFENLVFGFAANGQAPVGWLIGVEVNGPALWTGGEFGPDGSLIATAMLLIEALLILGWANVRGRRRTGSLAAYRHDRGILYPVQDERQAGEAG